MALIKNDVKLKQVSNEIFAWYSDHAQPSGSYNESEERLCTDIETVKSNCGNIV